MLRFSKNCDYCGEEMDSFDEMCPKCHEPNHDKVVQKEKNMAMYPYWKQILFFFTGLGGVYLIAGLLKLIGITSGSILNFVTYTIIFMLLMTIIMGRFTPLFKSFRNWRAFLFGAIGFFAIWIFDVVNINLANMIVSLIFNAESSTNTNQENINKVVEASPIFSLLIFGIVGPICEELTYRVGLFSLLRRVNLVFAFIITIIVFAAIHFKFAAVLNFIIEQNIDTTLDLVKELLNLPSYLFAGGVFTFLYYKFGFAGSITAHASVNFIGIAWQLLYKAIFKE